MESELRRVAGIVLGAPLTRRTRHELLYCLIGGLAGVAGFVVTVVLLMSGFTVSASIIGTVVGLLLLTVALRVSGGSARCTAACSGGCSVTGSRRRRSSSRAPACSAAWTGGCGTAPPGGASGTA